MEKIKCKFYKILESCWLCLRFPFLYPRNRFSGLHYNSWKIQRYLNGEPAKRHLVKSINEEGQPYYKSEEYAPAIPGLWDKAFENVIDEEYINEENSISLTHTVVKSRIYEIWYHIVLFYHDYILQLFHCIPTYTELDDMPIGWRKAFGIQMCKELRKQLIKEKYLYKYRITQIKEKFGTLRWYDACSSKEIQDIIQKYENISWNTCIVCGKPSTKISSGWICPYCDEHFPEYESVYQSKINNKWNAENEEEV